MVGSILDPHTDLIIKMWKDGQRVLDIHTHLQDTHNAFLTQGGLRSFLHRLIAAGKIEKRPKGWSIKVAHRARVEAKKQKQLK